MSAPQMPVPQKQPTRLSSADAQGKSGVAYVAQYDDRQDMKFKLRIANGNAVAGDAAAIDFKNLPLIAGFIGDSANFDLNLSFPNLVASLPDVTRSITLGAREYAPANKGVANSNSDGSYSQVQARFRDVNHMLAKVHVRTNNQDNILNNRFLFLRQTADLNWTQHSVNLDDNYKVVDAGNVSVFRATLPGLDVQFLGASRAMLIENLATNSWMEFELEFSFVGNVGLIQPNA